MGRGGGITRTRTSSESRRLGLSKISRKKVGGVLKFESWRIREGRRKLAFLINGWDLGGGQKYLWSQDTDGKWWALGKRGTVCFLGFPKAGPGLFLGGVSKGSHGRLYMWYVSTVPRQSRPYLMGKGSSVSVSVNRPDPDVQYRLVSYATMYDS